jgi:DNA repair exonuclease SbcCD nuclease subunit
LARQFRFIFYSDTHLGFEYPFTRRSDHNYRGEDFFNMFHRVYTHALKNNIHLVIHGGDVFYRSKVPLKLINMVYMIFLAYAEKGITSIIVPGNHERSALPPSLFLNHPNIKVFSQPKTFIEKVNGLNLALSGFPFVRNNISAGFLKHVAETGWRNLRADFRFLCLHQAIEGARVGPGNYTFRPGRDVVRIMDIPAEFDGILCGHIHRRQVLFAREKTPVIHSGSTEKTSFAEAGETKGFYEIELNAAGKGVKYQFIELPGRTMIDLLLNNISSEQELIKKMRAEISVVPEDAIIRINASINVSVSEIRKYIPQNMTVYFRYRPDKD